MNRFYSYIILLVVVTATLFSSCEKDELQATIRLSQQAIYFTSINESTQITYSGSNISSLAVEDIPDGWAININRSKKIITVVGPTNISDFEESLTSSTITFVATSKDDDKGYDYLTVGTTELSFDISSEQSNCFIASVPNAIYTFSAETKGENQEDISPASVGILWQSYPYPLSYSILTSDGDVKFHVQIDEDDVDEDGLTTDIVEGNAVIAAYDKSGDILWSWHIWVSDYSAEESAITLNGTTLMSRNIGANGNSTLDEDSILNSYGLYYQWGRKDPFIGPYYYNAAGSTDATMTDETGTTVYVSYVESSSSVGTESYAMEHPLTFILGVEDSAYDWLYSDHNSSLWNSDTKDINDPCPKGWRVAKQSAFDGLKIPTLTDEELTAISNSYGWDLSDAAGNSALFMGLGRRGYVTGKIQNVNLNEERPAPWAGYYWSCSADTSTNNSAVAMYFSFDSQEVSGNDIMLSNYLRSNGMQVRCQRDE
ncbi:MAG: hypothetical protein R3Y08_07170 [Rikenellaceae bacterium]